MKAQQARDLTNLNKKRLSKLPEVYAKIEAAASKGSSSITLHISLSLEDTVELRSNGYNVSYGPNPDPGHPCSMSETTIVW